MNQNIINKKKGIASNDRATKKKYNNWIIIGLICFILLLAYMLDISHEIINTNYHSIKKYYKF
jgi:hypothetical protein